MGIALKYFMCTWKGHEETLRVQILLNVILLVDGGGGPLDRREREREGKTNLGIFAVVFRNVSYEKCQTTSSSYQELIPEQTITRR